MATTIQISKKLVQELKAKKLYEKESYENLIWDLLEDTMELNEESKKDIEKARTEIKTGKVHTLSEVKKELEL